MTLVVALACSVLVSSSPGGPVQQAGEGSVGAEQQGVDEPAEFVDSQHDQSFRVLAVATADKRDRGERVWVVPSAGRNPH